MERFIGANGRRIQDPRDWDRDTGGRVGMYTDIVAKPGGRMYLICRDDGGQVHTMQVRSNGRFYPGPTVSVNSLRNCRRGRVGVPQ